MVNVTQGTGQETGATGTTPVTVDVNQTVTPGTGGTQDPIATISQEEVEFRTSDSWEIHGTLYHAKSGSPKTGIILLHQLGSDRTSYDPLIPLLHEKLPEADILAIDVRGQGESTNLGTLQKFKLAGDYKAMSNDIEGAKDYLVFFRQMPNNYYIVGASIGSTAAIRAGAEDSEIQKVVMISPGMSYKDVDITEYLQNYRKRLLIIAAQGDSYSASSAQTAYSSSGSDFKKLQIYEGTSAHGTDLFAETDVEELIVDWLRNS